MLTLKERKIIKSTVIRYDHKSLLSCVKSIYKKIGQYDADTLKQKLDSNFDSKIEVKYEEAYTDLVASHENMRKYIETVTPEKLITVNGITGPLKTLDFDICFYRSSCDLLKEAIRIYNDLNNHYDRYGEIEKKAMIVLCNAVTYAVKNSIQSDDIWAIRPRVEEIKTAEEKYGKKFFVKDWLYDTFTHPELFESYGVYKSAHAEANYSLDRRNIIQDRL